MATETATNERHYYHKLEAIKDIREKTMQLEKLKEKIVKEVKISDDEKKCLEEYGKELEHLHEEKMSHVEELRQIHADINDMENVIKQTKENQSRSLDVTNRSYEEYLGLKYQIDQMRRDYLGLSPLRDLHEEEGSVITKERFQHASFIKAQHAALAAANSTLLGASTGASLARPHPRHPMLPPEATVTSLQGPQHAFMPPAPPISQSGGNTPVTGGTANLNNNPVVGGKPPSTPGYPHPPTGTNHHRIQQQPSIGIGHHPTFRSDFNVNLRQQPPPMKSCLSCHQQIHRNAPICPLCKAKSRSRNPKKPKKKNN
ncbi:ZC4H2 family protein [Megaselia abdita]